MSRPLRDFDSAARAEEIRLAVWAGIGFPIGGALSVLLFEWNVWIGILTVGPLVSLVIWTIARMLVTRSGRVVAQLYTPTGRSTPFHGDLSREETLIVRGRLEDAIEALTARATDYPSDPRPRLRLAELYRDEIGNLEEAAAWYRRAAAVPGLTPDNARQVLRELLELCKDRLDRPEAALPALRMAADMHAGSRLGVWAGQEIRAIRAKVENMGENDEPRGATAETIFPRTTP